MTDEPDAEVEAFSWRCGPAVVKLAWLEGAWTVLLIAPCRLLGPPQVQYRGAHANPLHAAWDLQARVNHVSRDEDEALRAARSAARWLREQPLTHGGARR